MSYVQAFNKAPAWLDAICLSNERVLMVRLFDPFLSCPIYSLRITFCERCMLRSEWISEQIRSGVREVCTELMTDISRDSRILHRIAAYAHVLALSACGYFLLSCMLEQNRMLCTEAGE